MPEDAPTSVTLTTAAIAVGGVVFTALVGLKQKGTDASLEKLKAELAKSHLDHIDKLARAKIAAKFREHLMHSVYDLQRRIYNG